MEITPESMAVIERHADFAGRVGQMLYEGLQPAAAAMADDVGEQLASQSLPLKSRRGGLGLAGNVLSWPAGDGVTVFLGVPRNTPGSAYATIQEQGGTIRPRTAGALAIPLRRQAEGYTSPRDVPGLKLIPRKGRPPILAKVIDSRHGRIEPWYVLVKSVTLRATHWLSAGVRNAVAVGVQALQAHLDRKLAAGGGRAH